MADVNAPTGRQQNVWVKDKAGNEFICPVDALKDPKNATDDELKNCVDDASVPQGSAGGYSEGAFMCLSLNLCDGGSQFG